MRCRAKNARGEPCKATPSADGLCPAHRRGREEMREIGRLGGAATALKNKLPGLPAGNELLMGADWTLSTVEDARRWLFQISIGVLAKKFTHQQGSVVVRALEAWLRSQDSLTADELEELKQMAQQVKGGHSRQVAL